MEAYDFATATQQLYGWWQYELCDVFIELMKPVMAMDDAAPGASCSTGFLVYGMAVMTCNHADSVLYSLQNEVIHCSRLQ